MRWWQQFRDWLASLQGGPALDALLAHARPDQSLAERVAWAEDLLAWVRRDVPGTRLKLLLQMLERQPEARTRVAQTLRSLVRDTQALDLFADTGLPRGVAFTHELLARLMASVLPDPPDTRDLADIFDRLFPRDSEADWLEQVDSELAGRIMALFHHQETMVESGWPTLRLDLENAMVQLADRISVVGSHRNVRTRLSQVAFRELPFQKLPRAVAALLERHQAGTPLPELAAELNRVRSSADACNRMVDEVIARLETTGVSMALVYDCERLRAQVERLELLLEAWSAPGLPAARKLTIIAELARQNHARRSVRELCRQNLHLLTRRIVERNAETGEHYVARNGRDYAIMLRRAAGGGAVTGLTTLVKLLLAKPALAGFAQGAAQGLNYALSFVLIQLCGFTLATKQPATTAPALARRMAELRTAAQQESLVDEVVFLIRSQIASVFGNLALVIPVTFLLNFVWKLMSGDHLLNAPKAEAILATMSPASACWILAMFTGVLLWVSSLVAAGVDNWFVLHQLGPALGTHRGWQRWFGPTRARRLALWLEHNIAGLAGNISLGLMLGIIPVVAIFLGLPLDVRHVTLSTGQVTAAFAALGGEHFLKLSTLWIVVGILGTGLLNLGVSFALALWVAIRARNVRGPELHFFYRALLKRLLLAPMSFVLPIGTVRAASPAAH